jgi:site-specific DNA-methyltransferase (adenine-specific)
MLVTNEDNMKLMSRYEDNHFDLAIVDPPYGIGAGSNKFINGTSKTEKNYYRDNDWDIAPNKEYFTELQRVSKNQIIWGGNYFVEHLQNFRCFIFWDKTIHGNSYADGEMAWTSFDKVARYYRKNIAQVTSEGRMHPTQKPITLYEFILMNFAEKGNKILDTHLGSGSIALACHNLGYDLTACELDKEYYEAAIKRIEQHKAQIRMF